jgi:hypothetical protein
MKQLAGALIAAQKAIGSVSKDAKNSFANYDYVSAETMITQCRRALHGAGLVFSRTHWDMKSTDFGITVISKYLLSHPETGLVMELMNEMIVPPNQKQLDKAVLAALTTGLNYSLRDLLLIPRADEPEVDNLPEPQPKSAPKPSKAAAKQEPASGDRALALGLSMVFGLKPDAEGYEKALLDHASKKYDKKFTSTAELPDEYVKQVIEAHNIKMSEATAEDKALFGDK